MQYLYLNTNDIKENQKSIFLWQFSRFFYKLECNETKCRSEYVNFITNLKYKIIFSAFCITENLKDSSFYENFKVPW